MSSEDKNSQEKKENPRCFFDVTIGNKPGIYTAYTQLHTAFVQATSLPRVHL